MDFNSTLLLVNYVTLDLTVYAPQLPHLSTREVNNITTFLSCRGGIDVYLAHRIAPDMFAVISIINS